MSALRDRTPVVVAARRTPIGTSGHSLARADLTALLAPPISAVLGDLPADAPTVGEVIIGNCWGPGGNPARVAALAAGLGFEVPALTVDRQCGSGQEAVHAAANAIAAGSVELVLAGGAESPSTAPTRLARPLTPEGQPKRYDRAPFAPAEIGDPDMGPAAEMVARRCGITRERQDRYAARSHRLTLAAAAAGTFDAEVVPVVGVGVDERPRPITERTLARLRPAFEAEGTVTAGNCGSISDGAAVVAVVPEYLRKSLELPGLAVRGWIGAGVDPNMPGLGCVPAVQSLLARAGRSLRDVGLVEITEAFAAQVLATTDALGLDPFADGDADVCPQGGAIALGHPWGASGALLVVRLFAQMVRTDGPDFGISTCAIGGGQGLALLAQRVG
jgi:acetyl-CoA C-acetyltransferase